MPLLDDRNVITCATCTNRSRHRRRRRGGPPGFEVCIDPPNFVMKAGRALYFLAFVILLSARGAVFRIAAFAVHPAKPLRAISAVHVIATAAKGEVPAVFTADFGATFPITKIQRWSFVTRIAPEAFAFVAPDETDFVLVPFAYFAHTLKATLVIIGADADENHRDFFFLGTPFTKHQFARVASHERTLPTEACFTTQKVLVAKVAQWHSLVRVVT